MDENALELGLKLFQHSLDLTFEMGNSALEYFQKRSEDLEKTCAIYEQYIQYVNTCVSLQVVPRNYSYWVGYIL